MRAWEIRRSWERKSSRRLLRRRRDWSWKFRRWSRTRDRRYRGCSQWWMMRWGSWRWSWLRWSMSMRIKLRIWIPRSRFLKMRKEINRKVLRKVERGKMKREISLFRIFSSSYQSRNLKWLKKSLRLT